MGELEREYQGKVEFKVLRADNEEGRQAAMDYDFGKAMHGAAGFDSKGEHVFSLPGHSYGKAEIVAKLAELSR